MSMAQYGSLLILCNDEREELTRWAQSRTLPAGRCGTLVAGEHVTLSTQERIIVNRLRVCIEQRRSKSTAQSAPQLHLPRLPRRIPARTLVNKARGAFGARIFCSNRVSIR